MVVMCAGGENMCVSAKKLVVYIPWDRTVSVDDGCLLCV